MKICARCKEPIKRGVGSIGSLGIWICTPCTGINLDENEKPKKKQRAKK